MKLFSHLIFLLLATLLWASSFAQKKDSTWIGDAIGIVRDSAHNYDLPAATLAVYKLTDAALVSYQLSNNFGKFHFKELPVGIPLKIVVSYMGYKHFVTKFTIGIQDKKIDLQALNLERGENNLQGVEVIAVPPVQMNGDTLEFNGDAFRLDPNAQTEDLLRILPGVTVWGDGTITVNGKAVSSVLVDGKPFFGGNTRVATQNIPKNAVDKIQVYQQSKNPSNPYDSITQVNIKLKKNKRFGHFGKLSAGYGTQQHFEADASLNFFSPQTQIGIVGAGNNVNKVADDVNTLMRNSTFKGVGASIDYQPDFNTQGINQPTSGGFTFQHDFIPDPNYSKENRLIGTYFLKNNITDQSVNIQTITSLGGDSTQLQQTNDNARSSSAKQQFNGEYNKHKDNNTFHTVASFKSNNSHTKGTRQSSTSNSENELQSTNNIENESNTDTKTISFETSLYHQKKTSNYSRLPGDYNIGYSFNTTNNLSDQINKTAFVSIADPAQNQFFDRKKSSNNNTTYQYLNLTLGNLSPWIFGEQSLFNVISIKLQNDLNLNTYRENNVAQDKDTAKDSYLPNQYLTNNSRYTTINEMPALNFSRNFIKGLVNRYNKMVIVNLTMQAQLYHFKNISDHSFQNIDFSYQKFVPNVNITYNNDQYGDFRNNYSLTLAATSDYPAMYQLAPLVDSSYAYYIQQGNPHLKPTDNRTLSFYMRHDSQRSKNVLNYTLNVSAGIVNNYFADSSTTDSLGRSIHYNINADEKKYISAISTINKALNFGQHGLQVSLSTSAGFTRTPNNINGVWNKSDEFNTDDHLDLYYTYKNMLAINLTQKFVYYHLKQLNINSNTTGNLTKSTTLSASVNATNKLALSSNITYNNNTSTGAAPINFTIWNANVTYRFMKGNNFEMKFAALDLLHQNISIINIGSNNFFERGTTNVLQQYFMFTLSYYPRRFGKKEKKTAL